MFPRRYFAKHMFGQRYFPQSAGGGVTGPQESLINMTVIAIVSSGTHFTYGGSGGVQ